MKRWIAILPLAALVALAGLFAGYALKHDPHVNPAALVGKTAPNLALAPIAGGTAMPIRAVRPGPVIINFFASWCVPCVQEAPALMALKAQGVPIVGISYKDAAAKSRRFLDQYGDPFAMVLLDPDGRAGIEYGVSGVPETFLVDADGKVLAKHSGPLTAADAEELADKLGRLRPG